MPEIMAIENQILQTQAAMRRVELHLNRLLKLQKKQFIDPDTIDNQTQTLKELSFQEKQFQENLILAKMGARPEQIKAQKYSMLAAKQQFEQADWYVKHKTLVAPGDGYVFDTFYSVGELVAAQKPICVMVIPQNNYLEFFVNSHDLSQLRLGQELSYQLYGEKTQHQANISYIAASAEYMPPILYTPDYQEELVFRVRAKPQDASHFLLGQPVDVWI
jgi:HlyD family secretion protein